MYVTIFCYRRTRAKYHPIHRNFHMHQRHDPQSITIHFYERAKVLGKFIAREFPLHREATVEGRGLVENQWTKRQIKNHDKENTALLDCIQEIEPLIDNH